MAQPGMTLAERYELGERLGRGGMAEVFRATDVLLDREVAVKVLARHLVGDQPSHERFRREARAAASLNHRNVVQVHDTGTDDDTHFIVMELVEGQTLEDRIRRDGPLPVDEAIAVARDVCTALAAAHARGLVHRDVKPANVMFDRAGTVKVADFGLARVISQTMTATATVYGSAPYLAPEQARGDQLDPRTDIYAVGCVLSAMLTGEPPFTGDTPIAIVYQHLHEPPPAPSSLREGVPEELDLIVAKALAKDPDERYASIEDLASDLERVAGGGAPTVAMAAPIDRTQVLGEDTTVAMKPAAIGAAAARGAGTAAPTRTRTVRRRRSTVNWRYVALTVFAIAAVLVALVYFGSLEAGDPAPPRPEETTPPAAQTETTPPAETESPTPTPTETEEAPPEYPAPGSPGEAYAQTQDLIEQAIATGNLSGQGADKIDDKIDESFEKYEGADMQDALEKAEEARDEVEKAREKGQLAPAWADALHDRISALESQYVTNPNLSDGDGGGDGEGDGDGGD